jgi:hypothetical protein
LILGRILAKSRTSLFRRGFEFVALVFGLAALAVQAIAPICLSGFPAPHSSGGIPIVLCTAHGFQTVTLDADGKPIPATPAKDGSDGLCQMCTAFHSASAIVSPAALILIALFIWSRADRIVASDAPALRRAFALFITRGPPALRATLI